MNSMNFLNIQTGVDGRIIFTPLTQEELKSSKQTKRHQ